MFLSKSRGFFGRKMLILTTAKSSTMRPVTAKILQEGSRDFLFDTPMQDDVEGGECVAVEAEEIEEREGLQKIATRNLEFSITRCCIC